MDVQELIYLNSNVWLLASLYLLISNMLIIVEVYILGEFGTNIQNNWTNNDIVCFITILLCRIKNNRKI